MVWTYSGDPSVSNKDHVRFLIGDTDSGDPQLHDAEISHLLAVSSDNVYEAAIDAAQSLMAKYARKVNRAVGDLQVEAQAMVVHYSALVERLRGMKKRKNPGGIFIGNDPDQRLFDMGMHDYPGNSDITESY